MKNSVNRKICLTLALTTLIPGLLVSMRLSAAPSVSITSPANNAVFTVPANVTIQASTADTGGTITNVAFYEGTTKLGESLIAPYSYTWNGVGAGSYGLRAIATDNAGVSATSAVVNITVSQVVQTAGGGLYFDGLDDYVTFGPAPGLGASNFTLEVWFNWTGGGSTASTGSGGVNAIPLIAKCRGEFDGSDLDGNYFLGIDPGTQLLTADFEEGMTGTSPGLNHPVYGLNAVTPNVWHHAAVSYDGSTWQIYLDGNLENTLFIGQPPRWDSIQQAALGTALASVNTPGPSGFFAGVMDEARIWNYARSATQVASNRFMQIASAPGLIGRWGLDETSGTTAYDSSGSAVDGTLMDGPVWTNGYPFITGPSVALTSPTNGAGFLTTATITLTAQASSADGTVTNVEFFTGATKIGQATVPPYTISWNNPSAGFQALKAVATDSAGERGTSAPVSIAVYGLMEAQQTLVPTGSVWKYLDNGSDQGTGWISPSFNDASWAAGPAELGYGDNTELPPRPEATVVSYGPDINNKYVTTYFRHYFTINDASRFTNLVIRLMRDDGAAVYLNGTEMVRDNLAAGALYNTYANTAVAGVDEMTYFVFTANSSALVSGTNVLAVEIHQNAPTSSDVSFDLELVGNGVMVSNPPPVVALTSPTEGSVYALPTNIVFVATTSDFDGVSKVEFYANSQKVGEATSAPYTYNWVDPAAGNYSLRAVATDTWGGAGTSAVVNITINPPVTNTVAPFVQGQSPAPGMVTSLTSIQVTFSETVSGVDAADLLVNGVPATKVSGSGAVYTFSFSQPAYGVVSITWASNHGIQDVVGLPHLGFDQTGPGATWSYNFLDTIPPTVSSQNPPANAGLTNLTQIQVNFSEAVIGVNASDLLINGGPAISVSGSGASYAFAFAQPMFGQVNVTWAADHGITDQALNAFNASGTGATWQYNLEAPRISLVPTNAIYRLFKGLSEASSPMDSWRGASFDDSAWSLDPAPFFYDRDGTPIPYYGNTLLSDMYGSYLTIYLRHQFVVNNPLVLTNLLIKSKCDDGFIAWLNGQEIFRSATVLIGAGQEVPYTYGGGIIGNASEPPPFITNVIAVPSTVLVAGTNLLAIHACNSSLSSSDMMIDFELQASVVDPSLAPPTISSVVPSAGDLSSLNTITVIFSKAVTNVDASDLLINGIAATGLSGGTNIYTFTFAQPAYGTVNVTWATGHGITDLDSPPKFFNGTAPGATWQYSLYNPKAPTVASKVPAADATVYELTQIQVRFNEAVAHVDASDLLVNGVPASTLTGSGDSYTFGFPQPAYGPLSITWAQNHGITDLESPPNAFDATRPGGSWQYMLVDQTPPAIYAQSPAPNSTVSNLTQLQVTFSEPVMGMDAADLLVNGIPATGLSGGGTNYTFSFAPPNGTVINITWAPNHGIYDLATEPNAFNAYAPSSTWRYYSLDTVAPQMASVNPPPGATVRSLNQISVLFDEPVMGLDASDLLVNSVAAQAVTGSDAGPYTFRFIEPVTGLVAMAWASAHGIQDLASPPNPFAGGSWNYYYDPNLILADKIVISEIMFHPATQLTKDEWIELHNTDSNPMNLTGWRFTSGVDFTFPNVTIPGGGYLVIAADVASFRARYPGVTNVLGNWEGRLSNIDETLELQTAAGELVHRIHYGTEGDWAVRVRGPVYSGGYRGWDWSCPADGGGRSFELVNAQMPNNSGQNWLSSLVTDGTPGTANSVANTNIAPLILDVSHLPAVPTSTDTVAIRARIVDEQSNGVTVRLYWRNATAVSPPAFSNVLMLDDGAHSDGIAGDGIYGAFIPAQANLAVVEFYVEAIDEQGQRRTWPAPAYDGTTLLGQVANALYQVDNSTASFPQPMYRIIMTGAERQELSGIWASDNLGARIDAAENGSFITRDGNGTEVRYRCGFRNRGNGTRSAVPHNFRVSIPNDNRWHKVKDLNLNTMYTHSQVLGSMTSRLAGLGSEDTTFVRVRVNGVDLANSGGPQYGCYAHEEALDSDFPPNHFPQDGQGNLYRCMRTADLHYLGTNWVSYTTGGYNYSKNSNQSENDWTDIFNLTYALNNTPNSNYTVAVSQVLNMELFMRYFAVMSFQGFGETALGSDGTPDDYSIYRGLKDTRFIVFPHDHDTDFGEGDGSRQPPTDSIWRACAGNGLVDKLLKWPDFAPLYFAELYQQANGAFAPTNLNPVMDQLLGGVVPKATIDTMKAWSAQRRTSVLSQIPLNLTVIHSLTSQNGYLRSTTPSISLSGLGNAVRTRSIKVNGNAATWTAWTATWSSASVALQPGINSILVQAFGTNNVEIARTNLTVWYDSGGGQNVSGTLTTDTVWTPAAGPYTVTGPLSINPGVTLTIQPGTTVYLASGAGITVADGGRLLAEGTEGAMIRVSGNPSSATSWGGITINGSIGSPETRLSYVLIASNSATAIHSSGGTLYMDHVSFGTTLHQYLSLDSSSFIVQNCFFPTPTAQFEPAHGSGGIKSGGRGLFLRNFFGAPTGYNDVIDFTGGNRPGQPIVQFIDNVFMGSGDDVLDLDGTDAWVEGNIFMHVHKNGSPDTSSGVSGGDDSGNTSEVTIIENIFYDCDQAAMGKQGNFFTLINNTVLHQTHVGGTDTDGGVVCVADEGTTEGRGMYLEGNIMWDIEKLVRNQTAAVVTFSNNIMPLAWSGPGGGNMNVNPLFKHVPQMAETYFTSWGQGQIMKEWLSLQTGSPASGTGPNGLDKGAVVAMGASISGEPVGTTSQRTARLTVGINRTGSGIPTAGWPNGSGYTHYKWRLNGGAWSEEIPCSQAIVLTNLYMGQYWVDVTGKNDAGIYQNDPMYGPGAAVPSSRAWTVNPGGSTVRLNEILASNGGAVNHYGSYPDVIELYNDGDVPVDLTGMRLTDDVNDPDKYRIAAGTIISNKGYLVLYANSADGTPGLHIGFNLSKGGGGVYLYDRVERGGALLDSVNYGMQLTDLSIGRLDDGQWALTQPSFGAVNLAAPVGDPTHLKINEWLTLEAALPLADFVELYNPEPWPVDVGGLYLTDNPFGWPAQHQVAALSFIPAQGFVAFTADGDAAAGADHLNFKLSLDGGGLGLLTSTLQLIDSVIYSPQLPDISQGRLPDGGAAFASFVEPTPGSANPVNVITNQGVVINEVLAWNQSLPEWDGTTPDWVELYNLSSSTVSLADMSLTDDVSQPRRWVFPANARIYGFSYVRVICDPNSTNAGAYSDDAGPYLNTNFALKATGGMVAFYDRNTNVLQNVVNYGLQTADFSIGRTPDGTGSWALTLPTPGSVNIAASTGSALALKINEWMASETSGPDWFEVFNPNGQPVAVGGLRFANDTGFLTNNTTIPPLSFIGGGGTNGFQKFIADKDLAAGADHVNFKLGAGGDTIVLGLPGGIIDAVTFGAQTVDISEGRFPDGSATVVRFPGTDSPGESNYRLLTNIVINEALSHADPPSTNLTAVLEDAIELHNVTGAAVNVGGWYLSDSKNNLQKYRIGDNTWMEGNAYLVLYENQFNADPIRDPFSFGLSGAHGDQVYLSAADSSGNLTGYRTSVKFGAAEYGVSFGRYVNSVSEEHFVAMAARTFGVDDPSSLAQFRTGTGLANTGPKVGPIVVSEIMYHPPNIGTLDNVRDEFIELYNLSSAPVALYDPAYPTNTWWLRDAVDYEFPMGATMPAHGRALVVSFDPVLDATSLAAFRATYTNLSPSAMMFGPYRGKLANSTAKVELYKPDAPLQAPSTSAGFVPYVLVERIKYVDTLPWPPGADGFGNSLQRIVPEAYGNDPTNWVAAVPTPAPGAGAADSDGDGIPDAWMVQYFGHPTGQAGDLSRAADDADHDGLTNLEEYLAGTDPQDAASGLRLESRFEVVNTVPSVVLRFTAVAGKSYTILYRDGLTTGVWTTLITVGPQGSTQTLEVSDPVNRLRFYRLRTQ